MCAALGDVYVGRLYEVARAQVQLGDADNFHGFEYVKEEEFLPDQCDGSEWPKSVFSRSRLSAGMWNLDE